MMPISCVRTLVGVHAPERAYQLDPRPDPELLREALTCWSNLPNDGRATRSKWRVFEDLFKGLGAGGNPSEETIERQFKEHRKKCPWDWFPRRPVVWQRLSDFLALLGYGAVDVAALEQLSQQPA